MGEGVLITTIHDIQEDMSINETHKYLKPRDYEAQSQALFTIMDNIEIFPKEYVHARNSIKSESQHRNGFGALYSIASEVHPAMNGESVPNNPPTYSTCKDIYEYETKMRNYYSILFIKKNDDRSTLEKAQEFIKGLAVSPYSNAAANIQTQLTLYDNNKNSMHFPQKYLLNKMTLTIRKLMKNDPFCHDQGNAIVNTTDIPQEHMLPDTYFEPTSDYDDTAEVIYANSKGERRPFKYNLEQNKDRAYGRNDRNNSRPSNVQKKPWQNKYQKPRSDVSANKQTLITQSTQQCEACGTFGHGKAHQCWALPKHILMSRWAQKYTRKAEEIAKAHLLKKLTRK